MKRSIAIVVTLIGSACSASRPTDAEGWTRVVGTIAPELSSIQMLQVPTSVTAGVPFSITVSTVGSSSCTRSAGMDASVTGSTANVTPYDSVPSAPTACTRDLRAFPRTVNVTFASPGTATIRVNGRQDNRPLVYDATITVDPR